MYLITISMNPKIVRLFGDAYLDWHGLLTVIALICGVTLTFYLAKKSGLLKPYADTGESAEAGDKPKKKPAGVIEQYLPIILVAVVAGIIMSRLFHVVDQWEFYSNNPSKIILNIWSGSSIIGAVVGGAVGAAIYAKFAGWSWTRLGRLADVAAPGSIMAMAIGRIGCIINGDAWGTPTTLSWGFMYTHPNRGLSESTSYVGHPAHVYEIIWDMLLFAFLMIFRNKLRPACVTYLVYLSVYSLGRFLITFVRVNDPYLWSLKQAHVVTLVIMIVCVPLIFYLVKNREKYEDYA
jgi:phosphatidylglycerol:prolipoprotein diacylglycerol transferase